MSSKHHSHFHFPVFGLFFLFRHLSYMQGRGRQQAKPKHLSDKQIVRQYQRQAHAAGYRTVRHHSRFAGFRARVDARAERIRDAWGIQ